MAEAEYSVAESSVAESSVVESDADLSVANVGGQDTIGPNVNDPNATGPNASNPDATGTASNDPNAIGPTPNDPNATGPTSNDPKALGPTSNNPNQRTLLIGLAVFCCIFAVIWFVFLAEPKADPKPDPPPQTSPGPQTSQPPQTDPPLQTDSPLQTSPPQTRPFQTRQPPQPQADRFPNPASVDFGFSRFDAYCNLTYNPPSVRRRRQTVGNRSFVSYAFEAFLGSYPYVVMELTNPTGNSASRCTGTIIDARHVLTAAHCVTEKARSTGFSSHTSDFIEIGAVSELIMGTVVARSRNPTEIQYKVAAVADAIYQHSNYDSHTSGHLDVALIRLNTTLNFNDYIKPVCLAGPRDHLPSLCLAMGYGEAHNHSNAAYKLLRGPSLPTYSTDFCATSNTSKDYFYDGLNPKPSKDTFYDLAQGFLPIFYRGKLCAISGPNRRSVCPGDSGGPLMCTPAGVASNAEYNNPASPLFRTTDPTLKQFGIHQGSVGNKGCGDEGQLTIQNSVKDLRLWMEYVAWPALQDVELNKMTENTRREACIGSMDWRAVSRAAKQGNERIVLTSNQQRYICRKFNSYMLCAGNSPQLDYCDHLYATIYSTQVLPNSPFYLDLLPFFKLERCRQQPGAAGC